MSAKTKVEHQEILDIIDIALEEDIRDGDHTTLSCIPANAIGTARLLVKEDGVLAGVDLARMIFQRVNPDLKMDVNIPDGARIHKGDVAFTVQGRVQAILVSERLVLNFMQRMSGIASLTNQFVQKARHTGCKILDTRKTTPVLRSFEKWAVRLGGGHNHRMGLYDMIMIKDNHVDFCGGIPNAIKTVNTYLEATKRNLRIEIETRNLEEVQQVLDYGNVHRIMLDNFELPMLRDAVRMIDKRFETEASGGVNLKTVTAIAETGVDFISVGQVTHSAGSLDLSLKAVK